MPLTPAQIAAPGTEHAHQCAFFQWLAIEGVKQFDGLDLMHAIPNGADYSSASVGSRMKAEGLKAGVPDTHLPVPAGPYPGLYIELKVPANKSKKNGGRSDKQVEWHLKLRARGFAVVTAYGWAAMVVAVQLYYAGNLVMPDDGDSLVISGDVG
jgi:hypothetical protein